MENSAHCIDFTPDCINFWSDGIKSRPHFTMQSLPQSMQSEFHLMQSRDLLMQPGLNALTKDREINTCAAESLIKAKYPLSSRQENLPGI